MKKVLIALIIAITTISTTTEVKADIQLHKAKATAYCIKGTTATGTQVTEGRTVASRPEWFGACMVMYKDDGDGLIKPDNYIGTYIVEDTGGRTVRNGSIIDVYISDYDRAIEFGCINVIVEIVDAEG